MYISYFLTEDKSLFIILHIFFISAEKIGVNLNIISSNNFQAAG